jgi:exoribonuclease-2
MTQRERLATIAHRVMLERGLAADFAPAALQQLAGFAGPSAVPGREDLRDRLWCSIDNDDSLDLDQISVGEELPGGAVRILVAIAGVDDLVKRDTPLDDHAKQNTTSIYTAGGIFPMLPERLSTNLTSLNGGEDRDAFVIAYTVAADGSLGTESVSFARVHNRSKLAYNSVSAWLDGKGPLPPPAAAVPGMDQQLRLQDRVAQLLRSRRRESGALDLETIQPRAVFQDGEIASLDDQQHNRGTQLIEELMVACNGVVARFLRAAKIPSLRRVVRVPKRWDRIVAFAAGYHTTLPAKPDSGALEQFLTERRTADPLRFPDLSLMIVKMLGPGEYVVEAPGDPPIGHFGLAVRDYTHSTAPNRRFPDLITQRMVKSTLARQAPAYAREELEALAAHCTEQENAADKVERQVRKSAAAIFLEKRIGESFQAIVTGVNKDGTWVRTLTPPVEGKLVHGAAGLDVGHRLHVKLIGVNVEAGFIDFVRLDGQSG